MFTVQYVALLSIYHVVFKSGSIILRLNSGAFIPNTSFSKGEIILIIGILIFFRIIASVREIYPLESFT